MRNWLNIFSFPHNSKQPRPQKRVLRVESLESRKVLTFEGELFELDELLDTTGLYGELRASIDWGDRTPETVVSIDQQPTSGPLKAKIIEDTDASFYSVFPQAKPLFEAAVNSVIKTIANPLSAIIPGTGELRTKDLRSF